jgi:hypothetical protein
MTKFMISRLCCFHVEWNVPYMFETILKTFTSARFKYSHFFVNKLTIYQRKVNLSTTDHNILNRFECRNGIGIIGSLGLGITMSI